MASLPLKVIEDLYYKAIRNPGRWYGAGRGYEMYAFPDGSIKLSHYGTVIWEYNRKKGTVKVDGWSASDVGAINSMQMITGKGAGAYIEGGKLYAVGTGKRFPATVVPLEPLGKVAKRKAKKNTRRI